ncbi:caspase family protein [Bradyrhizobium betae]
MISRGKTNPKGQLADALDGRCWAYHVKGLYELAVADCRASISLRPDYSYSYNNLASAYLGLKRFDDAANSASKSIELKPKFFWSHLNLARALAGSGQIERALVEYRTALALDPKSAEAQAESRALVASTAPQSAQTSSASLPVVTSNTTPMPSHPTSVTASDRRIALVIGNSRYRSVAELPNPVRDANLIAQAFRSVGFSEVRIESNLSRDELNRVLLEFSRKAAEADWAVVYYSGHGIEVGGVDYLIPVDARLQTDRDVDFETVPLALAISAADSARRLRMVIMDACRSNPFLSQMKRTVATRSLGRGLAAIEPEPGSLVIFSAKHGETALDGEGANSPFAIALAKRLSTPGLEVRRLFDMVRDDVVATTNRRQQPFSYGSLSGSEDYYFATK